MARIFIDFMRFLRFALYSKHHVVTRKYRELWIIESFKEVKLMHEGKLPKRSWKDFRDNREKSEDKDMETVLEEKTK